MSWSLNEQLEGHCVFHYLTGRETFGSAVAVCTAWRQLYRSDRLWQYMLQRDCPEVAAAMALKPRWAPGDSHWHRCYSRLARAKLHEGIPCPGCRRSMVPSLLELFELLAKARDQEDPHARTMICVQDMVDRLQEACRQDSRSVLSSEVLKYIIEGTCSAHLKRQKRDLHHGAEEKGALCLEGFLEYFRELLAEGDCFNCESGAIMRSLRPWSTSAAHNLICRMVRPEARVCCIMCAPPRIRAWAVSQALPAPINVLPLAPTRVPLLVA